MSLFRRLRNVLEDPPPAYVFEISHAGIAYAKRGETLKTGFRQLEPDVLAVSPLRDNVLRPDALFQQVQELAGPNGNRRRRGAALILPDYCARIAILDFDNFPSDRQQQLSLVRFRVKKSIPFDLESAVVNYQVQSQGGGGKKYEVVVAVIALEIVARYEAPFRAAGLHPGFVTNSILAAMDLLDRDGVTVTAKLGGNVLTVLAADGKRLKLMRCVELGEVSFQEVMTVIYPTFAYVEDELGRRPNKLLLCGLDAWDGEIRRQTEVELGAWVEPLRSRLGDVNQTNAGLLGYLETIAEN